MPVPSRIYDLSGTANSNSPAGADSIGTSLDDYLRAIQGIVRGDLASKGADIASATTTDLGAVQGLFHDITGTTTITGFGTVAAGVWKVAKFEGALTLTHNGTTLILPGATNITTADGDIGIFVSEGSGNWRCVSYVYAAGKPLQENEEGTFTPALQFGGGATGMTYSNQIGYYTRLGDVFYFEVYIQLSAKGSSTGTATVTGFPFNIKNVSNLGPAATFVPGTVTFSGTDAFPAAIGTVNASVYTLLSGKSGGSINVLTDASFTNASDFRMTGFYKVA